MPIALNQGDEAVRNIYETPEIAVVSVCFSETVANDNDVILSAGNIFPPKN